MLVGNILLTTFFHMCIWKIAFGHKKKRKKNFTSWENFEEKENSKIDTLKSWYFIIVCNSIYRILSNPLNSLAYAVYSS